MHGYQRGHDIRRQCRRRQRALQEADAICYARDGVPVTESQHRNTTGKRVELVSISGFAEAFLPAGQVPITGALFYQPRMAAILGGLRLAGLEEG